MKFLRTYSKTITVVLVLSLTFIIYLSCSSKDENNERGLTNADGIVYAGSLVCAKCHNNIYNDFIHTAHFHTSSLPTQKNIKGSFNNGSNIFPYNYSTFLVMEQRNQKFYQVEYQNGNKVRAESIYLVIGSGTRGQSYLYMHDSALYQLPVSYFTSSDSWSNSPGFPFYEPMFTRFITARCLECHSTFADMDSIAITDENKNPKKIILGVECESCHGPAEKHVKFEEENHDVTPAKFIINPAHLSRQQKIEMCTYCHSNEQRLVNTSHFTFKPGDSLSKYLLADSAGIDTSQIDVHGNQTAVLLKSKCFKMSKLDCTTCHDTHKQERGNLVLFSQRCLNCHNEAHNSFCKFKSLSTSVLKKNCIDCHMPTKQSKILTVNLNQTNDQTPVVIRTHFITVYPNVIKQFLEANKLRTQN